MNAARAAMLLLTLASTLAAPALAADKPTISVQDDGSIIARMLVDAPVLDVRRIIPDVQVDASLYTNVLTVKSTAEGDCRKVHRTTRGLLTPLSMNTRFCPTPTGWREYLVQSEDYSAYDVEWTVEQRGTQAEIAVHVRSDVNLFVPDALVRTGTIQGVNESFLAILKRLLAGQKAP